MELHQFIGLVERRWPLAQNSPEATMTMNRREKYNRARHCVLYSTYYYYYYYSAIVYIIVIVRILCMYYSRRASRRGTWSRWLSLFVCSEPYTAHSYSNSPSISLGTHSKCCSESDRTVVPLSFV